MEIALEDYPEIDAFHSLQNIENVITIINQFKPDIILLDINLSNISSEDGLEVAKMILDSKCNTKIVVLTGYDLPVYQYEAQKLGVSGFINKNILPEVLVQILSDINKGAFHFPTSTEIIEELTHSENKFYNYYVMAISAKKLLLCYTLASVQFPITFNTYLIN